MRELAPDHAAAKPLPNDPTKLEPGGSYSGPITAALVMSSGGGAQPLTLHLTIHDAGGVWQARLIDSTSKKVIKPESLRNADAIFLTLSSLGIVSVTSLDGEPVKDSPLVDKLRQAYWEAAGKG